MLVSHAKRVLQCVWQCDCCSAGVAARVCGIVTVTARLLRHDDAASAGSTNIKCVAVCCSVLQCVAVCCSVLQCVAVYCSVLKCVAVY